MEILLSFLNLFQKSLFSIGPFFLLLGVLIFIHELGHFLVARYFDVKVKVFSLGFGPKILKYKKGETIYCVSLLPLGGYVKMAGDNPLEDIPDSEKERGFLYKSVPEKWLIAFAGPFMNLIFTLLILFILAFTGLVSYPAQLGDIKPGSKAYEVGFRSGDKVLSINDKIISYYEELKEVIQNKVGEKLIFKVQSQENQIKTLSTTVRLVKSSDPLNRGELIGSIEGLGLFSKGLRIGVIYDSPAHRTGLRTFDEIVKVNGEDLKYWRDLESFIKHSKGRLISLSVKRESEIKSFAIKESFSSLALLGIEPAYLYVDRVGSDTPAHQAGLLQGDRLVSIDGKTIQSWEQVLDSIRSYSGEPFSITYQRQSEQTTVLLSPKALFVEGNVNKRFMLGIVSGGRDVLPEQVLRRRSLLQSFFYSGTETWRLLDLITTYLVRLIQGEVSLRTMGGPIMIGRVAHSSFQQGFQSFLFIMALISLNLFFLNLLPIPMLDGGHLLFFSIEGILGRSLSVKKLLIAQQLGLLVLLSFMGLVFFNDIYNWLKAW